MLFPCVHPCQLTQSSRQTSRHRERQDGGGDRDHPRRSSITIVVNLPCCRFRKLWCSVLYEAQQLVLVSLGCHRVRPQGKTTNVTKCPYRPLSRILSLFQLDWQGGGWPFPLESKTQWSSVCSTLLMSQTGIVSSVLVLSPTCCLFCV